MEAQQPSAQPQPLTNENQATQVQTAPVQTPVENNNQTIDIPSEVAQVAPQVEVQATQVQGTPVQVPNVQAVEAVDAQKENIGIESGNTELLDIILGRTTWH